MTTEQCAIQKAVDSIFAKHQRIVTWGVFIVAQTIVIARNIGVL